MFGGLQGEEWKFIQKYLKENISRGVGGTEENSHRAWAMRMLCECCASFSQGSHNQGVVRVLCEFRTRFAQLKVLCECCASFAQGSHNLKVLCEFGISLEQLSSEGHIFVISAPNRTRFEALDFSLPEP